MSIAVSAVIRPSRLLRAMFLLFGAANLGAGLALGSALSGAFSFPHLLAGLCLLAAALALRACAHSGKTHRIDISGLGQIRLTVQQNIGSGGAGVAPRPLVQLLSGSTLWPQLLLLRLRDEEGAVRALALLPDNVEDELFRSVAVALRDIAARNIFLRTNEIL